MIYKLQIKTLQNGEWKWNFIHPFNKPDYEYKDRKEAERMLGICIGSNNHEFYRVKEILEESDKNEKFFNLIKVPEDCDGCDKLIVTRDPFSTGDSPTEYECEVDNKEECPCYVKIS